MNLFERKASNEDTFKSWSKPASDTEETHCENALRMIKDAISSYEPLNGININFIRQGSYKNNTNVKLNSDVDIAVQLKDSFFPNYPKGMTQDDFGHVDASYTYYNYRADIKAALIKKFGEENVTLGDKSIKIHSNTYRVDADVVPCIEHRRYREDHSYISGTEFRTRINQSQVINFPEQHFDNGVTKNTQTSRRFKRVVRILKRARYNMGELGYDHPNISSFLIECLVWNVPNNNFNNYTYTEDVQNCLDYLITYTSDNSLCSEWGEVSDLLYLFVGRKYTLQEVNDFLIELKAYLF